MIFVLLSTNFLESVVDSKIVLLYRYDVVCLLLYRYEIVGVSDSLDSLLVML